MSSGEVPSGQGEGAGQSKSFSIHRETPVGRKTGFHREPSDIAREIMEIDIRNGRETPAVVRRIAEAGIPREAAGPGTPGFMQIEEANIVLRNPAEGEGTGSILSQLSTVRVTGPAGETVTDDLGTGPEGSPRLRDAAKLRIKLRITESWARRDDETLTSMELSDELRPILERLAKHVIRPVRDTGAAGEMPLVEFGGQPDKVNRIPEPKENKE